MAKILRMPKGGSGRGRTPAKTSHRETDRLRQDAVDALELINPVVIYLVAEKLLARDADAFSGVDTEPNVLRIPLTDMVAAKRAFPAYRVEVDQERMEAVITMDAAPEQDDG